MSDTVPYVGSVGGWYVYNGNIIMVVCRRAAHFDSTLETLMNRLDGYSKSDRIVVIPRSASIRMSRHGSRSSKTTRPACLDLEQHCSILYKQNEADRTAVTLPKDRLKSSSDDQELLMLYRQELSTYACSSASV